MKGRMQDRRELLPKTKISLKLHASGGLRGTRMPLQTLSTCLRWGFSGGPSLGALQTQRLSGTVT